MKKHPVAKTSQNGETELLQRSAARGVRLTAGGFAVTLLAALALIMALIAGPLIYAKASRDRTRIERLLRESAAAEAEVC